MPLKLIKNLSKHKNRSYITSWSEIEKNYEVDLKDFVFKEDKIVIDMWQRTIVFQKIKDNEWEGNNSLGEYIKFHCKRKDEGIKITFKGTWKKEKSDGIFTMILFKE